MELLTILSLGLGGYHLLNDHSDVYNKESLLSSYYSKHSSSPYSKLEYVMVENNITSYIPIEIYQKEMKEMQREINYLRSRVVTLNDLLIEQQKHTTNSIEYLQDSIDDMQMDLDLR